MTVYFQMANICIISILCWEWKEIEPSPTLSFHLLALSLQPRNQPYTPNIIVLIEPMHL